MMVLTVNTGKTIYNFFYRPRPKVNNRLAKLMIQSLNPTATITIWLKTNTNWNRKTVL